MKIVFSSGTDSDTHSAGGIPIGTAFYTSGSRYIRLSDDVFLGDTGSVYRLNDFPSSYKYRLLPPGTSVTIVTER